MGMRHPHKVGNLIAAELQCDNCTGFTKVRHVEDIPSGWATDAERFICGDCLNRAFRNEIPKRMMTGLLKRAAS